MGAAVLEADARAGGEVLDRPRHQHLAGFGDGRHPGGDVHGDPADLAVDHLAFPRVEADAHLDAEGASAVSDRATAGDGAGRTVERREETIPGGVDLAPGEALELPTHQRVMGLEKVAPGSITHGRS